MTRLDQPQPPTVETAPAETSDVARHATAHTVAALLTALLAAAGALGWLATTGPASADGLQAPAAVALVTGVAALMTLAALHVELAGVQRQTPGAGRPVLIETALLAAAAVLLGGWSLLAGVQSRALLMSLGMLAAALAAGGGVSLIVVLAAWRADDRRATEHLARHGVRPLLTRWATHRLLVLLVLLLLAAAWLWLETRPLPHFVPPPWIRGRA